MEAALEAGQGPALLEELRLTLAGGAISGGDRRILLGLAGALARVLAEGAGGSGRLFQEIFNLASWTGQTDGALAAWLESWRSRQPRPWLRSLWPPATPLFEGGPRSTVRQKGAIRACALLAAGRRLATAAQDGSLRLWDVEAGREVWGTSAHQQPINGCVAAGDASLLTASDDGTMRLWTPPEPRPTAGMKGHAEPVLCCATAFAAGIAVSGSADATLRVWRVSDSRCLRTLRGHEGPVLSCALTADGQRLVSASADATVRVWDVETGWPIATLRGHAAAVRCCRIATTGELVLSSSDDGSARVWDLRSLKESISLDGHGASVTACEFSRRDACAVTVARDGELRVFSLPDGILSARWSAPAALLCCSAGSPAAPGNSSGEGRGSAAGEPGSLKPGPPALDPLARCAGSPDTIAAADETGRAYVLSAEFPSDPVEPAALAATAPHPR